MSDVRFPLASQFGDTLKQELFEQWQEQREPGPGRDADDCTRCGACASTSGEAYTGDGYCGCCLEDMFNEEMGVWNSAEDAIDRLIVGLAESGVPNHIVARATCSALESVLLDDAEFEQTVQLLRKLHNERTERRREPLAA